MTVNTSKVRCTVKRLAQHTSPTVQTLAHHAQSLVHPDLQEGKIMKPSCYQFPLGTKGTGLTGAPGQPSLSVVHGVVHVYTAPQQCFVTLRYTCWASIKTFACRKSSSFSSHPVFFLLSRLCQRCSSMFCRLRSPVHGLVFPPQQLHCRAPSLHPSVFFSLALVR